MKEGRKEGKKGINIGTQEFMKESEDEQNDIK